MPSGAGPHWLPPRAELCQVIGRTDVDDQVEVHLQQRVDGPARQGR